MPLSIRSARAEELARRVAELTGETMTQAIVHALEDRLTLIEHRGGGDRSESLAREIMEIARRCSALPDRDRRSADEILGYDESGVPANGN